LPGSVQILAEVIQAGSETLQSEIQKLINSIWNKKELPDDHWKESNIVPIYKKCNKTECSNYCEVSLLSTACKIVSPILSRLIPYTDEITGISSVSFDRTYQLLISFFPYWRKNGCTVRRL
jgi:hypothetical protein